MFDMKLFVDTDADTRLARRGRNLVNNSYSLATILELNSPDPAYSKFNIILVLRDIEDRGRDLEQVLHQYTTLVKPAFEEFCLPVSFQTSKRYSAYFMMRGISSLALNSAI